MEHVRADPKLWVHTLQRIISPIWRKIADGCHFTGTPWVNIERAHFDTVEIEHFVEKIMTPNLIGPHILGVATK